MNGRLAALNRFINRSTDKCRPFFQVLKKNGADFCWNQECEMSFQGLKKYLASPPLLSKPSSGETISLSRGLGVSGERSPSSERRGYLKASVLRQQFHERPTDEIPKARKAGACSLHHFKEVQALFLDLSDHNSH